MRIVEKFAFRYLQFLTMNAVANMRGLTNVVEVGCKVTK